MDERVRMVSIRYPIRWKHQTIIRLTYCECLKPRQWLKACMKAIKRTVALPHAFSCPLNPPLLKSKFSLFCVRKGTLGRLPLLLLVAFVARRITISEWMYLRKMQFLFPGRNGWGNRSKPLFVQEGKKYLQLLMQSDSGTYDFLVPHGNGPEQGQRFLRKEWVPYNTFTWNHPEAEAG